MRLRPALQAVEAAVGAAAVGTPRAPGAAAAAGTMVAVGPAMGGTDDPFRAGREAAAARTQAATTRAMVVGGDAGTTQGHVGIGAAMRGQPHSSSGSGQPSGVRPRRRRSESMERATTCSNLEDTAVKRPLSGNTGHASVGGSFGRRRHGTGK